jgi:uncharacterized membrane protein
MNYNWPEILKNKPEKEVYDIFMGKTHHGNDIKELARLELERRNFNFNDLSKHKEKWELEKLILEERLSYFGILNYGRSWNYLIIAIGGIVLSIVSIIKIITGALKKAMDISTDFYIVMLFFGVFNVLIGYILYKKVKKREKSRNSRIKEIIDNL